jgi:hypothetical protein
MNPKQSQLLSVIQAARADGIAGQDLQAEASIIGYAVTNQTDMLQLEEDLQALKDAGHIYILDVEGSHPTDSAWYCSTEL